jgi:hypothetical protein
VATNTPGQAEPSNSTLVEVDARFDLVEVGASAEQISEPERL